MAWWVVCQHVLQLSGVARLHDDPVTRFLTMGGLAVLVFVIISGFVIANMIATRREPYRRYLLRRFLRIYPLYLVALLAALALHPVYGQVVAGSPWAAPGAGARFLSEQGSLGLHALLHLLLVQGVVPGAVLPFAPMAILAPAWSLSLEWQFYVLAPALVAALFDGERWAHVAAGVACLASLAVYVWGSNDQWAYPAFLPLVIGFFLLGMLSRMVLGGVDRWRLVLPGLVTLANFLLYARAYTGDHLAVAAIPLALWGVTLAYCVMAGRDGRPLPAVLRPIEWVLATPGVVRLGLWSYSTYLLHLPLLVLALWALHASGLPVTEYWAFATMLAACAILVPLSGATYRMIEQKGMRAGLRLVDALAARRVTSVGRAEFVATEKG